MIFIAVWLATMGIAPFAWPDHTWTDLWFPLDLLLHGIGLTYIIFWYRAHWRDTTLRIRSLRQEIRDIRERSFK